MGTRVPHFRHVRPGAYVWTSFSRARGLSMDGVDVRVTRRSLGALLAALLLILKALTPG